MDPTRKRAPVAWWWSRDAHCEFCSQGYAYGAQYHCIHCDRPICPLCIVVRGKKHRHYCPQCAETLRTPSTKGM
jgi:hypothetical protein